MRIANCNRAAVDALNPLTAGYLDQNRICHSAAFVLVAFLHNVGAHRSPSGGSLEQVVTRFDGRVTMRGYFAAGTDGISKPMNLGNLLRIAHAFGASFFFTIAGRVKLADAISDTSDAAGHLPIYQFPGADDLRLPQGCELVGVEITDHATELPSFRHPLRAAYVFGSERF